MHVVAEPEPGPAGELIAPPRLPSWIKGGGKGKRREGKEGK